MQTMNAEDLKLELQKEIAGYCCFCGKPNAISVTEPIDDTKKVYKHLYWSCKDCLSKHQK